MGEQFSILPTQDMRGLVLVAGILGVQCKELSEIIFGNVNLNDTIPPTASHRTDTFIHIVTGNGKINLNGININNYGCWCMFNDGDPFIDVTRPLKGGKQVDIFDTKCMELHKAYTCAMRDVLNGDMDCGSDSIWDIDFSARKVRLEADAEKV